MTSEINKGECTEVERDFIVCSSQNSWRNLKIDNCEIRVFVYNSFARDALHLF